VVNAISAAGGNFEAIPPYAVTIGMGDILSAKRIRLCAHRHLWQRAVWRRAVLQESTARYPVTFIQQHADAAVMVDEETAAPAVVTL
jgi:glucosamine-6-phosphate deaminase